MGRFVGRQIRRSFSGKVTREECPKKQDEAAVCVCVGGGQEAARVWGERDGGREGSRLVDS